ncbi:hypothetical protein ACQKWADRAFT_278365 [Trichoderma austrokoningii]
MQQHSIIAPQFHDLTYPRLNLNDHTLDENLPVLQSRPDASRLRPPPNTGAGALDALPLELVVKILSQLDLRTLVDFRRVNRRALELVDSHPEYKAVITHANNALRGILGIKTGRWITCSTLYEALCTPKCEQCSDFGGYLYLLTCKRVCFRCLSEDKLYLPLPRRRVSQYFGLDYQTMKKLPQMRAIPGIYSPDEKKTARYVLFDYESALCAGVAFHGSFDAMNKFVSHKEAQRVKTAQNPGPVARRIRQRLLNEPHDRQSGNPLRFVAITRVPWLNKALQELEWGFYCIGCKDKVRRPLDFRRQFTKVSFEDHLRQCGNIQNGRHQSD